MTWEVREGDCLDVLRDLDEASVDAIVTDPPYGLGFMGKEWDTHGAGHSYEAWCREWAAEAIRVLKPGGHLLAFGGARTYHRLACGIEDAGFEIRDCLSWMYGSGFPKSLDVSKAIDKLDASEERRRRALAFTGWLRSTGITARQIDEATGSKMGGHYLTDKEQPAVPTAEMFERLRPLLPDVPEWVEELVRDRTVESRNFASREVVGVREKMDTTRARIAAPLAAQEGEYARREVAITRAYTPEAQAWEGWGTGLKPAWEPIILARKPLDGTVAQNVLEYGTGALNIDACRIGFRDPADEHEAKQKNRHADFGTGVRENRVYGADNRARGELGNYDAPGRWPANVTLDEQAAAMLDERSDGASRFFYVPKPSTRERNAGLDGFEPRRVSNSPGGRVWDIPGSHSQIRPNYHPTVKPVALMRWLVRLVTPPGGLVLDPFTGSGTTGIAAVLEGFCFLGIEREAEYVEIARARIAWWERTGGRAGDEREDDASEGQLALLDEEAA